MQHDHQAEQVSAAGTPPKRILIVEDEQDILESMGALVGTLGSVIVRTATDGREALRVLSRERIDLLITDHRMPRMNGLELMRMVHIIAPGVPSILVTAYPDETIEDFARRVPGFVALLPKPCDPAILLQHVGAAIHI